MLKGTHCVTMLFNCVIPGVVLRHVHHPFEGPSKTKLEQELESVDIAHCCIDFGDFNSQPWRWRT